MKKSKSSVYQIKKFFSFVLFLETAHCADMYPATPEDSQELIEVRKQIYDNIGKWISMFFDVQKQGVIWLRLLYKILNVEVDLLRKSIKNKNAF